MMNRPVLNSLLVAVMAFAFLIHAFSMGRTAFAGTPDDDFYIREAIADYFYRSAGTGDWSDTSTWEQSADGATGWGAATEAPNSESKGITILTGHTVTVDADVTIDQTTVESGATLSISGGATLSISGDITVNGNLSCQGSFNANGHRVSFNKQAKQTLSGAITLGDAYISNELEVPAGSHLTFSAGSTVTFKTGSDYDYSGGVDIGFLNIKGKLTAVGASASRITFTREGGAGYWGCVVLNQADDTSSMTYCDIEYAHRIANMFGVTYAQGAVTFRQCNGKIENSDINNIEANSFGIYTAFGSTQITNNSVTGCKAGIYTYDSSSRIVGNLVRECEKGIFVDSHSTVPVYNNTLVKNNTGVYFESRMGDQADLKNNIIWGSISAIFEGMSFEGTITVTYSCVQGGYFGEGNISDNPLFADYDNNDFTLRETSPCVDTGTPDTTGMGLPAKDLAGNTRIVGGRVDMGAYECQQNQAPTVTTQAASDVATTSATGNGNITDLGTPDPTAHGVCWSTSENPTTADSKTNEGAAGSTGAFTSSITGLNSGTTYHYRAYATNDAGTGYGADTTFTTPGLYFRSAADGNWSDTSTWEQSADGSSWVAATATPNSGGKGIAILSGYTVTVDGDVTIDQTTVEAGATLAVSGGVTLTVANGDGTDLAISGTISNSGSVTGQAGSLVSINSDNTLGGAVSAANLTIAGDVDASSATALSVSGTLTVGSGTFTSASDYNDVAVTAGATLTLSGDITVSGNFDCQGTFNAAGHKVSFDKGDNTKQILSGTLTLGNAYIRNELEVPSGSHLTFSAGSVVTFKAGNWFEYGVNMDCGLLNVKGRLTAIGTTNSHITFNREASTVTVDDTEWGAVVLNTADDASHINYCDFEYGRAITDFIAGGYNAEGMVTFYQCDGTVENSSFNHFEGSGIGVNNADPNILNNTITGDANYEDSGISCEAQSAPYIYGNTISNTEYQGVNSEYSSPRIINNTIINCSSGVSIAPDDNGNQSVNAQVIGNLVRNCVTLGILQDQGTAVIYNNTIVDNPFGVGGMAAEAVLRNNIIWNNTNADIADMGGSTFTVTYSCVEDGYAGEGNIQDNPLFTDSASDDFTLTANSPCVNTGTPDTTGMNLPSVDLAGNARIAGGRIDMGAYEAPPSTPAVTTQAASGVGTSTATGNGDITDLGGSNPTAHGVCWSTSANPTTADSKTDEGATSATGAFTSSITGLTPGTTYHYRAYATNNEGTGYGADRTFTTQAASAPTVTTQGASGVNTSSATLSGNITDLGTEAPTAHGVCWSTSANPTVDGSKTNEGAAGATGVFTSGVTGLNAGTTYHYRAYATNAVGTGYGEDKTFTTDELPPPPPPTYYSVTFNLDGKGTRTGGGELSQSVLHGGSAVAPTVQADEGWSFTGWDKGFTNVQSDLSVTARYAATSFALTYSASTGGSISGPSPQTVPYGGSGSPVTAKPDTGHEFDQWSDGSTDNPRTDSNVTADISVTARFSPRTYTLAYTAGAGGRLTGATSQKVAYGASGSEVGAVPDAGYEFLKWSDESTANPRTDTNVASNISVTAEFAKEQYLLEVTGGTGSGGYEAGAIVNITADPAPEGKLFDEWVGDTSTVANVSLASTTLTMPGGDISIAATYKDKPVEKIVLAVTRGTGSGEYEAGAIVSIAADPAPEGKVFDKWTGATATVANVNMANTSITIPESDISVAATYKDKPVEKYVVSVISGTGSGEYETGAVVGIAADPAPEKMVFAKWTGDTATVANINLANTVVTMPEGDISIAATYKKKPVEKFILSVTDGAGGGEYEAGAVISVSANQAPEGKVFERWTGQTSTIANVSSPNTSVTMPDSDVGIAVRYMDKPDEEFDLTVNSGTGSGSFMAGEVISIAANPAAQGRLFDKWTGQTSGIANISNPNTTMTMPDSSVVITAAYKEEPAERYELDVQSGTGSGEYEAGRVVTIAATPADEGWIFDKWVGQTSCVSNINIPNTAITMPECPVMVQATYKTDPGQKFKLEVKTETWKNRCSTAGKNGASRGAIVKDIPAGQLLNLVAPQAPEGFVFDIWTGQTANVANVNLPRTTIYMPDADVVVVAAFKSAQEKSVLRVGNGIGSGEYEPNTAIRIYADAPAEGKMFDKWTGQTANVENINLADTTIVMPSTDVDITAVYRDKPVVQYSLTVANGTGTGLYAAAEMIGIAADAAPQGYRFSNWTGQISTVENIYSATTRLYMPPNEAEIIAVYKEQGQTYAVTATAGEGGGVTPASVVVEENETASFTLAPDTGYTVNATVGGTAATGTWSGNVYTTGSIDANSTVIFSFIQQSVPTHIVTATAGAGGSVTPASVTVNENGRAVFTVIPDSSHTTDQGVGGTAPAGTWNADRTAYTTGVITSGCSVGFSFTRKAPTSCTVTFDLGDKGQRTGGGALTQTVESGTGARAPVVSAAEGWALTGWDRNFADVTSNMTVTAVYQPRMSVWDTEVTMVNPLSGTLRGTLKGFDAAGNLVWSKAVQLNAHGRACLDIRTEAGDFAYAIKSMRFDVESQDASATGTVRYYRKGNTMAAVPGVSRGFNSKLIIPHVASTDFWWTGVGLTNHLHENRTLNLVFDNGKNASLDLGEEGYDASTIAALFGDEPQPGMGSGYADKASDISGILLFGEVDLRQLAGLALDDGLSTEIVFPHVVSDEYWWTGIVLHNPNAEPVDVELVCYNESGEAVGTTRRTISGHTTLDDTAVNLGFPAQTAWFKAQSSLPITGFELFGVQDQDRLAGVNVVNIASPSGELANIQQNGWSGLVFVNPSSTPASVTLEARDDNGALVDTKTLTLGALTKLCGIAQSLFEADIASATHVRFSADQEITAFQLNGMSNPDRIEGVPALGSPLTRSDTRIYFPHIAVD